MHLPEIIELDGVGEWVCCLVQCSLGLKYNGPYFLCTDFCADSIASDVKLPVLRVLIDQEVIFDDQRTCVPVKVNRLVAVRIFLVRFNGERDFSKSKLTSQAVSHLSLILQKVTS